MALYRASAIVAAVSGKLGGVVFVRNKGSNVVRHRPAGRGGRSIRHELAASQFVAIQRLWRTLSTDDRAAWRAFARDYPSTNRLGITRSLSPYQAFVRFNVRSVQHDDGLHDTPTSTHSTPIATSMITIAVFPLAAGLVLRPAAPPPNVTYIALLYGATKSVNYLPPSYTNWRFLGLIATEGDVPFSVLDLWSAAWPLPQLGQDFALRADFYSPLFRLSASIFGSSTTA